MRQFKTPPPIQYAPVRESTKPQARTIEFQHDGTQYTIGTHTIMGRIKLCSPALFRRVRNQKKLKREVYNGFLLVTYDFVAFKRRSIPVHTCDIYAFDILLNQVFFMGHCPDEVAAQLFVDKLIGTQAKATVKQRQRLGRLMHTTPDMKPVKLKLRTK